MTTTQNWVQCLNSVPGTIVSAGTESIQAYPFNGLIKNLAIVMSENHPWIDAWKNEGIKVFCLEDQCNIPAGNTGRLLLNKRTLTYLHSLNQPVHILMFKPDARSSEELESLGFHVLGCQPICARRLENKLLFPSIAREAGVSIPITKKLRLKNEGNDCHNRPPLDYPFVCQFAKGFSGNRTFLIRSFEDWRILNHRFPDRTCRVSQWSEGDTWTANGCVFADGTAIITVPFLQETRQFQPSDGLPPRIGSRGNRWGIVPDTLRHDVTQVMKQLGTVMFKQGFQGFFGADLVVTPDSGKILGIEINPRITASAPVLTPFEMTGSDPPLIASHIAASLELDWPWRNSPVSPPSGGQLIFRPDGTPVPDALNRCVTGVYRWIQTGVEHLSDAHSPSVLQPGEFLIWKPLTNRCSSEILRVIYRDDPNRFHAKLAQLAL